VDTFWLPYEQLLHLSARFLISLTKKLFGNFVIVEGMEKSFQFPELLPNGWGFYCSQKAKTFRLLLKFKFINNNELLKLPLPKEKRPKGKKGLTGYLHSAKLRLFLVLI
jgi:hypothetical protein